MSQVEIEIPPRSPYVGVVRLVVSSLARAAGLDEEAVDDLRIAVSEACANSVLAQEATGVDDPVLVTWDHDDERVVIDVRDHRAAPDPSIGSEFDSQGFSSREVMSTALLESLVDRFESEASHDGGSRVRLTVFARRS